MNWTTEFPTEEGWYWLRYARGEPDILYVRCYHDGRLSCEDWGELARGDTFKTPEEYGEKYSVTHWAGPIPEPK